jgi:hypothetical protein
LFICFPERNTYVLLLADNVAFDPVIRNVSGADEAQALFGDWFSYSKTARALIFARNQSGISSLDDMKRMMRYNNYQVRCGARPQGPAVLLYDCSILIRYAFGPERPAFVSNEHVPVPGLEELHPVVHWRKHNCVPRRPE